MQSVERMMTLKQKMIEFLFSQKWDYLRNDSMDIIALNIDFEKLIGEGRYKSYDKVHAYSGYLLDYLKSIGRDRKIREKYLYKRVGGRYFTISILHNGTIDEQSNQAVELLYYINVAFNKGFNLIYGVDPKWHVQDISYVKRVSDLKGMMERAGWKQAIYMKYTATTYTGFTADDEYFDDFVDYVKDLSLKFKTWKA